MFRIIAVSITVLATLGLALFILRSLALIRPPPQESSNFFKDEFEIVAHRGGNEEAPENTLPAFEAASRIAEDMIFEFDVHLTKDKQPVVIHDASLERTTNGSGKVKDFTLEELKKLDAGFHHQSEAGEYTWRGKGVQIPTLIEVITRFKNRLIIEIKSDETNVENIISKVILDADAGKRVLIGSQNSSVLSRFKKIQPSWAYSASRDDVLRSIMLISIFLEPMGSWQANAYLIPEQDGGIKVLSTGLLTELKRRGKKVLIWTVNNIDDMTRLKSLGVNGLITDRPRVAYKLKSL